MARTRRRSGFTLIELIVVIIIVATLASIVIPMVDNWQRPAQIAVEAETMNDLFKNLEYHQVTRGNYPDRFDSLVASGGTVGYSRMAKDIFLNKHKLVLASVADVSTQLYYSSLKKAGVTTVMWHDENVTDASLSGTIVHPIANGDLLPTLDPTTTATPAKINAIYPSGTVPWNVRLVVLGAGPSLTSIGQTMVAPPISPHPEDYTNYRRYLVVFACYADGSRAKVKAVFDRHADTFDHTMAKYMEESRPR